MVREVVFSGSFERSVRKLHDASLKERIKRQIAEIVERPEIGKPLRFARKGERAVRVNPFRIIYSWEGETIHLLVFEKRDKVYR